MADKIAHLRSSVKVALIEGIVATTLRFPANPSGTLYVLDDEGVLQSKLYVIVLQASKGVHYDSCADAVRAVSDIGIAFQLAIILESRRIF